MNSNEEKAKELKEDIEWYLERIQDPDKLHRILTLINRIFIGRKV